MSNALAIAGVTAVLKDLLDTGVVEHQMVDALGAGVAISALPPDRVPLDGPQAGPRINLFLHRVSHNAAWRNSALPSHDAAGRRVKTPPLALDLHYLLTAYGTEELHAEVLLGYGLLMLHETPVLTRESIRTALQPSPVTGSILPSVFQALRAADLADQVELLKITPEGFDSEEMSRLWSALQGRYRPTAAFQVSVVLIERPRATVTPLPVLTRGRFDPALRRDVGVVVAAGMTPPFPTLEALFVNDHGTPNTLRGGDTVDVSGHHLGGSARSIVLRNDRFGVERDIPVAAGSVDDALAFTLPLLPDDLPAGIYTMQLRVQRPGEPFTRLSNALPIALAPAITSFPPLALVREPGNLLRIRIACTPAVLPGQQVALAMDGSEAPAQAFATASTSIEFRFPDAPPAGGTPLLRLKVDGIESVVVDRRAQPPAFFDHRIVLPA
ncbi:MAG: DUF4255 domain-containing protein [Betaproteobacteria bacterium]|jgi:hypothetical protein|nr:DUF4255 domain-containing protein [Betaproteobacteria bacterium]